MFERLKRKGFQVLALYHAEAILKHDFGTAIEELEAALGTIKIPLEELVRGGGGEAKLTQRLRRELNEVRGWAKHRFEIQRIVDGTPREAISHEIDHVKIFAGSTIAKIHCVVERG